MLCVITPSYHMRQGRQTGRCLGYIMHNLVNLYILYILTLHADARPSVNLNDVQDYETCIRRKIQIIKLNRGKPIPRAVVVQGNDDITMPCNSCLRPGKSWEDMNIRWFRVKPELEESEEVPIGKQNYGIGEKKELIIESIREDQGAQYFCVYREQVDALYYLEVIKYEVRKLVVLQGTLPRLAAPVKLKDNNLYLYTKWSEWSTCSACDQVGLRRKTGTCYVQKLERRKKTKPEDVAVLDKVIHGMPCRSSSVSTLAATVKEIRRRKSETLVDYCYTECPTRAPVRNVTDEYGNVIDQVEGEDVFSVHESRPPVPPAVHRETHYLELGSPVNFACPRDKLHNDESVTTIRWDNGSILIDPISIRRQTRGRVYIDATDRLIFRLVKRQDTGYYSCWQDEWLVAVFRIVEKDRDIIKLLPDIAYYSAIILTIICTIVLGVRMYKTSKDKRYK